MINLIYIHVPGDAKHETWAMRFLDTYFKFPPESQHKTLIVCNGRYTPQTVRLFAPIGAHFFQHDDSGWDIGAYQAACSNLFKDEVVMCLGGPTYFKRSGWLKRLVDAWKIHGPGMYGTLASYEKGPHLNTSGFLVSAKWIREYPVKVVTREDRYEFEHGDGALWRRVSRAGQPVMLVTWDGVWPVNLWRTAQNIYHKGDQSNCLTYFRHSDIYDQSNATEKARLTALADSPLVFP